MLTLPAKHQHQHADVGMLLCQNTALHSQYDCSLLVILEMTSVEHASVKSHFIQHNSLHLPSLSHFFIPSCFLIRHTTCCFHPHLTSSCHSSFFLTIFSISRRLSCPSIFICSWSPSFSSSFHINSTSFLPSLSHFVPFQSSSFCFYSFFSSLMHS